MLPRLPDEPKSLTVSRIALLTLLALLLLAYTIVSIIRAVNSPVLLDTTLLSQTLSPPTVILQGSRAAYQGARIIVQGVFLDSSGQEQSFSLGDANPQQIILGQQLESAFPDDVEAAIQQNTISWWIVPNPDWRFYVPVAAGETAGIGGSDSMSALRYGVILSGNGTAATNTTTRPPLVVRLWWNGNQKANLDSTDLVQVATAFENRMVEVQTESSHLVPLKGQPSVEYDSKVVEQAFPTTPAANYYIQFRPSNVLNPDGNFQVRQETERLATTWFDVIAGIGGLLGILTTAYALLFGAPRLKPWGPAQYLVKDDLQKHPGKSMDLEKEAQSVEDRVGSLESHRRMLDRFYIESSLFKHA